MRSRTWGLLLVLLMLALFGITIRSAVQADELLQDAPRLDGMNIYFTEANKEASRFDRSESGLSRFAGLLAQLGASLYTLDWRGDFPTNADLIVVAAPLTDFRPDQIARLWAYENNAGSLLLLADTLPETERAGAFPANSSLLSLMWADIGLRLRSDVVVARGAAPTFADTQAEGTDPVIVGEHLVLITDFTTTQFAPNTPMTANLTGALAFFTARSLEIDSSPQSFAVTPLVFSSDQFYGESNFAAYETDGTFAFNIGEDTTPGLLPLAVAFENARAGVRGVVIGDGQFASNGAGLQSSPSYSNGFLYPNNARFLINAVAWLVERPIIDVQFSTPAPTATVTITPSPTPTVPATATATPSS
jgi:hypothetical protein